MRFEPSQTLVLAQTSLQLAEQASTRNLRLALAEAQKVVNALRCGAPFLREENERHGLEFALAVNPSWADDEALEFAVDRLLAEGRELVAGREAVEARRAERGWQAAPPIAAVMLTLLLTIAAYSVGQRLLEPVDLAEGKPWLTSSTWANCTPRTGRCGPLVSRILFHTGEDENPWFRIDFGAPTTFSAATIVNRSDDAPERASPLVLEVSDDGQVFSEVVRRESQFSTWKPSFAPVTARFVRLRVPRKTWLHLESVKVHP